MPHPDERGYQHHLAAAKQDADTASQSLTDAIQAHYEAKATAEASEAGSEAAGGVSGDAA